VDQVRLDDYETRVIHAELFLHARHQVDDHDIRYTDEIVQHRATALAAVVERHALLVAIHAEKPE
jgi:hypothetical protein